jgi:vancomycin resistance protein YoaR
MPTPKRTPANDQLLELEDFQEDDGEYEEYDENAWQRSPLWLRALGTAVVVAIILTASFEFVYAHKIYPGVTADGIYLGGLSKAAAGERVADRLQTFSGEVITISDGDTDLRIPVASLGVSYDAQKVVDLAYDFGRQGNLRTKIHAQARALLGRTTPFSDFAYNDDRFTPYAVELAEDLTTPVQNASLNFDDSKAQVTPAATGTRLDLGRLTQLVNYRLGQTSTDTIHAPVYQLTPDLATAPLQAAVGQINDYVSGPITVSYSGVDRQIDQKTIVSWIEIGAKPPKSFLASLNLADIYPPPPAVSLGLSQKAVVEYVADLAKGIDQNAQNATLSMQDGQLAVSQASRDGIKVDQADAVEAVLASLKKSGDDRHINLKLQRTTAEVNETNLAGLGIKELIAEGETTFPGSSSSRLINIRAGAKRFNNTLIKPGETFSFGKILGAVGPETGYVPELVILADHEEKQYGGGLCQVASTAYRAALLAGLPITERHNHSFAVSFYTAPYGVPGVDATIYYPQVDLKFVNDTGAYILIQTTMQGTDLKFDYYGTKTKYGQIRGPEFLSGTIDATQPSRTVFYRDILDLAGAVTKTDRIETSYKSSKDFPVVKQYN